MIVFVLFDILYSWFLGEIAGRTIPPRSPILRQRPLGFDLSQQ
jgi:hypothetical protein